MSQHSGKVLLLEMLFMSPDPQFEEGFTQSLLKDSGDQLEGGLNSMLASFSVTFFKRFSEMQDLRKSICKLQGLEPATKFNSFLA